MKITRYINGEDVLIELEPDELFRAYREQKLKYDKEDVQTVLEERFDVLDIEDRLLDRMVAKYIKYREYDYDGWREDAIEAIKTVYREEEY